MAASRNHTVGRTEAQLAREKMRLEVLRDLFLDAGWRATPVAISSEWAIELAFARAKAHYFDTRESGNPDAEWVTVGLDEDERISLRASWGHIAAHGKEAVASARAVIERAGLGAHLQ
jgi:hypothetical protein